MVQIVRLNQIRAVVQKVTFLGNTDNVNFGWFAYDSSSIAFDVTKV